MTNKRLTKGLKTIQKKTKSAIAMIWDNDFGYVRTVAFFTSKIFIKITQKLVLVRKYAFDVSVVAFVAMIGTYVFFPAMANADMATDQKPVDHQTVALMINAMENETKSFGDLPVSVDAKARKTYTIPITAYTSEVGQTDDSPCITASGMNVCKRGLEDVVAANFLPMGTHVRIPELYGDRIFTVQDRMNARYDKHMDIWLKDLKQAKQFGLKQTTIEVF
ncbi:MAG: hypothetical protein NTX72_00395 [Candidatus Uhrbacteria bacterium]|nr:hypothetical protein [Candidatus Uhrbacteria bacterium]